MPRAPRSRLIAAGGFILAAAIGLAALMLSMGPPDSNYFGPNEPTWVRVPTTLGDPVYVGVLVLHAHPGDSIVVESLTPDGLLGDATVEPIARVVEEPARLIGGMRESDLDDVLDLSAYGPVAGLRFSAAVDGVELAVRISGTTSVHGFDGVRLRFRVDAQAQPIDDWIPLRASVCSGATMAEAVEVCAPIASEMHEGR